jgi:hypothetical protein
VEASRRRTTARRLDRRRQQHSAIAGRLGVKGAALGETRENEARPLHPTTHGVDLSPQIVVLRCLRHYIAVS